MIDRYNRQIKIDSIGIEGQNILRDSRVLVVGAGGLGSAAIYYLAAAGIGHIGICDDDSVMLSNLNRQILHFATDIGSKKTTSAMNKINLFAPEIVVVTHPYKLSTDNSIKLFNDYDIIIGCVDNKEARKVLNHAHLLTKKPLIDAAVNEFSGYIFPLIHGYACYNCVYPLDVHKKQLSNGIVGATAGMVGSLQALEAIKILLSLNPNDFGHILYIDLLNLTFQKTPVTINKNCLCQL